MARQVFASKRQGRTEAPPRAAQRPRPYVWLRLKAALEAADTQSAHISAAAYQHEPWLSGGRLATTLLWAVADMCWGLMR